MRTLNTAQEMTELQAAQFLGITLDALHRLLDVYIFNNGTPRPFGLMFNYSDLLLLSYWNEEAAEKVVAMPRRG